ncbi:MAG: SDR family oxidoreductase [Vicinamibacterales bacterium]
MLPSITEILHGKTLLLTGVTGLLGKVILHQLLVHGPESLRIACLVRRGPDKSADDRFRSRVLGSELFRPLRRLGWRVGDVAAARIEVVEGDIGRPDLGLAPDRFRDLAARVDVIVNCAGHVDLEGALDVALSANTLGPDELLRFALAWRAAGRHAPPALAHVSTCFVSGTRSGPIREEIVIDDYPRREELGIPFFPGDELQALQETVERVRAEVGLRSPGAERWLTQRLAVEGRARAGVWGWPNVHTFTKALGERALAAQHAEVPLSIVRPSIIGAAMREPVPGWTEGAHTIPTLALIAWRGHRYYPIHPRQTIDVIPVDFVANATIAIAAMTLSGEASGVYHLSSGDRNPLDANALIDLTAEGLRRERKRRSARAAWKKRIRFPLKGTIVPEQTYRRYSAPARARWWSRTASVLERLPPRRFWARGAGLLRQWERDARFADSVFEAYRPFLYAAQPIFEADRTHDLYARLTSEDRERFAFAPHTINWRRYWIDIEIEGVLQHAFPAMGEELRPLHPELAGESIGDLLESAVRRHAPKIAVEIWSPQGMTRWTYDELAAHVAAHAGGVPETVHPIVSRVAGLVAEGPVHAGLVRRVVELSESIELTSRDTVLALSPLHCDGALAVSLLLPLARGARVLCLELDPDTAAADWRSVRIGMVVGTAADIERWRASPAKFGPQFRGFVCCDEL